MTSARCCCEPRAVLVHLQQAARITKGPQRIRLLARTRRRQIRQSRQRLQQRYLGIVGRLQRRRKNYGSLPIDLGEFTDPLLKPPHRKTPALRMARPEHCPKRPLLGIEAETVLSHQTQGQRLASRDKRRKAANLRPVLSAHRRADPSSKRLADRGRINEQHMLPSSSPQPGH